jgi:IS4 transposase
MSRSRPWSSANPDLRRPTQVAAPAIEPLEQELYNLLSPADFKPLRLERGLDNKALRERILTLPVIMAVVLSLVYRQIAGLSEVVRVLREEGLLWVEPLQVSKQALSKRLMRIPASAFAVVFEQVLERLRSRTTELSLPTSFESLSENFQAVWIADGSTLEELRRKLKALRDKPETLLGGKLMMVVEAFSHRPVASWYTDSSKANDKTFADNLLECLPPHGLLIFDLGFFKFGWFDEFTNAKKFFVTRLREKTAYNVTQCLSQGLYFRDEIIQLGQYRSNPCQHPLRLVSVLWGDTWYYYLTNVLDPQQLSAKLVCELYRRRWRVEEAFLLTKRLLGLSYLWVGDTNGVQIQIFATWIFYAVLNDLCSQVALALNQPLERISVEMVFRGLYHFARAFLRGDATDVVAYFQTKAKLLGLVKARRKRHRVQDVHTQLIWGSISLS